MMQEAVLVEQRPHRVLAGAQDKCMPTGIHLPFRRTGSNPVLEAVDRQRQFTVTVGNHK